MNENNIDLKPINDLLGCKFFIPSYQRGYRWTDQQVTDLLDDIWEFAQKKSKKEGEFYCIQPIVVKEKENKTVDLQNGIWEIIDGQQRLTTILIILNYFNQTQFKTPKKIFDLEFQTRAGSQNYLLNIDPKINDENIDYYHIWKANKIINEWFLEKEVQNSAIANEFYPVLINLTKVIWYQVNDGTDAINIFTRINIGKIPLTNAELIKALFLSSDNFEQHQDKIKIKQSEIAGEWDNIELKLQKDEFWLFLNKEERNIPTRIEFIFSLMAEEINSLSGSIIDKKHNEYFEFMVFNQYFKNYKKINPSLTITPLEEIWKEIKKYFLTFEEWFEERDLFHWIGFLVTCGLGIKDIKVNSTNKTKKEFKEYLINQIKHRITLGLHELEYGKNNIEIIKTLLLFNIQTILENANETSRFPFDKFKKEKWSLEHIHAQNSDGLTRLKQWNNWIGDHIKCLKRINEKKYSELINELEIKNNDQLVKDEFERLFHKVIHVFNDHDQDVDKMHSIQNLALLDKDTNSALNKSVFDVKRELIKSREKVGSFIPICTRNVFMKYYTNNISQAYFWGENDRIDYLKAIETTLESYLPKPQRREEILNASN